MKQFIGSIEHQLANEARTKLKDRIEKAIQPLLNLVISEIGEDNFESGTITGSAINKKEDFIKQIKHIEHCLLIFLHERYVEKEVQRGIDCLIEYTKKVDKIKVRIANH